MKKLSEGRAFLVAFTTSCVSLLITLGVTLVFGAPSSGKQSRLTQPHNVDGQVVSRGRQIFVRHCAQCHGFDARGYEGTDLHNIHAGDKLVRQVIIGGIRGEMPAYGTFLSEADVQALMAYLRTVRN